LGSWTTRLVLVCVLLIGGVVVWAYNMPKSKPAVAGAIEAGPADLAKAAASGLPYVAKIGSDSCIPCRQMNPIMDSLARAFEGKVGFYKVDVYRYQDVAAKYGVRVIPTLVLFAPGGSVLYNHEGYLSEDALTELMRSQGMID
jgi:thioredoxin 1